MEGRISGRTQVFALLGSPVSHSGSPAMYNYSFERLGIDAVYVAFDIPLAKTMEAMEAVRTLPLRGCNVTMPCKTEVVQYLDELSAAARLSGAVNTIVNENGRLKGYMTDGEGFVRSLQEHGVSVAGKKLVIAGSGGAATAIQVQCALDGARELVIFNRTAEKARRIAERICSEIPACRIRVCALADQRLLAEEMRTADIFANGTSVGMAPETDKSVVEDAKALRQGLVVADIVYHPRETRLLREARAAGCVCIGGAGMLLWQGAAAFSLYTGQEMPVAEVRERFFNS